jgi:hypothetical protein
MVALLVYLPIAILIGIFLSGVITVFIPVWNEYILAVLLPIIGIAGAWFIMPKYRYFAVTAYLIIGLVLAYLFAFPSFYPEGHEKAYQDTYLPFILTVVTSLVCITTLAVIDKIRTTRISPE